MPVMIAAGYDAIIGIAIIMIGAGIGVLGSTINSFATVIRCQRLAGRDIEHQRSSCLGSGSAHNSGPDRCWHDLRAA